MWNIFSVDDLLFNKSNYSLNITSSNSEEMTAIITHKAWRALVCQEKA